MNKNYGYQLGDEEDNLPEDTQKPEPGAPEYAFDGYDVEINLKVALLPKTTGKP